MDELVELSESQQRLDILLAELGDDGMMLGQLDGYLCGIAASPEPIAQELWLPLIWGAEDFDVSEGDRSELVALVLQRYQEIEAELAEDKYAPLYELDENDDDTVLWEVWAFGFETAMSLQIDGWNRLLKSHKESQAQEAAFAIMSLLDATDPQLAEAEQNNPQFQTFVQDAPRLIPEIAATLYRAHRLSAPQTPVRSDAVGRNDPCPCGSGVKYKRCHGAA